MKASKILLGALLTLTVATNVVVVATEIVVVSKAVKVVKDLTDEDKKETIIFSSAEEGAQTNTKKPSKARKAANIIKEILR